jgi:UDP-N-acetylmuramyl pentapeptide synthase
MTEATIRVCATHQEAADAVLENRRAGDVVLVKGSRGMKREEVIRLIRGATGIR